MFNLLRQAVAFGIVGIGQTIAILSGGIDLSVGSLISLSACLTSGIMIRHQNMVVPIVLLVLLLGVAVGFGNGFMVSSLRIPPFIATLAMSSILQGAVLLYTKKPVGGVTRGFMFFANGQLGPIPFAFIFWIALLLVFWIILRRSAFGIHVYAVGSNEEVARLSGINTSMVKVGVYVLCALMAALTGIFLASRLGIGDPLVGQGFELESITAVLLGGTSLAGGKGGLEGTIAGVLIIALINNILNLLNVSGFWQWLIKGVVVIVVVSMYKEKKRY
ncbi:ABC transporter permease [Atrimonas thermophila]|uniref:ABC transporter permease n=1 Tax=Atrimonas thermophila TaxID=3064161 RepID=UPI00399CD85D